MSDTMLPVKTEEFNPSEPMSMEKDEVPYLEVVPSSSAMQDESKKGMPRHPTLVSLMPTSAGTNQPPSSRRTRFGPKIQQTAGTNQPPSSRRTRFGPKIQQTRDQGQTQLRQQVKDEQIIAEAELPEQQRVAEQKRAAEKKIQKTLEDARTAQQRTRMDTKSDSNTAVANALSLAAQDNVHFQHRLDDIEVRFQEQHDQLSEATAVLDRERLLTADLQKQLDAAYEEKHAAVTEVQSLQQQLLNMENAYKQLMARLQETQAAAKAAGEQGAAAGIQAVSSLAQQKLDEAEVAFQTQRDIAERIKQEAAGALEIKSQEVGRLKLSLQAAQAVNDKLRQEYEETKTTYLKDMATKAEYVQQQLENTKTEHRRRLKQQVQKAEEERNKVFVEAQNLATSHRSLREQNAALQVQYNKVKTEVDNLSEERVKIDLARTMLTSENDEMKREIFKLKSQIQSLQNANQESQHLLDTIQQDSVELKNINDDNTAENRTLQHQLQQARAAQSQAEREAVEAHERGRRLGEAQAQIKAAAELKETNDSWRKREDELSQQLAETKSSLDELLTAAEAAEDDPNLFEHYIGDALKRTTATDKFNVSIQQMCNDRVWGDVLVAFMGVQYNMHYPLAAQVALIINNKTRYPNLAAQLELTRKTWLKMQKHLHHSAQSFSLQEAAILFHVQKRYNSSRDYATQDLNKEEFSKIFKSEEQIPPHVQMPGVNVRLDNVLKRIGSDNPSQFFKKYIYDNKACILRWRYNAADVRELLVPLLPLLESDKDEGA